jgi:hypothetical protein
MFPPGGQQVGFHGASHRPARTQVSYNKNLPAALLWNVDPEFFFSDPDPIFQLVPDPDPVFDPA